MAQRARFSHFKTGAGISRLAMMTYIQLPLSLHDVEGLLHERGIDICYETVGACWSRFGQCSPRRSASDGSTGCSQAAEANTSTRCS